MLEAVARSRGRFKAIAVVAPDISDTELMALADRGVVGVRFNLVTLARAAAAGLLDGSLTGRSIVAPVDSNIISACERPLFR
jgi:hypothetical protein